MRSKQYSIREKICTAQKHCQILKDHQKDIFKTGKADHKTCHNMLKRIQVKHEWQNSSKKNHKIIKDKVIEELMAKQFAKTRLKTKFMAHGYNYLAVVGVLREGVKKKIRRFLSQLQSLSEDNNSSSVPEKIEKDDFEIVVFSDENDEKNNKAEDD
ncbi:uncharacterized protein CIMG_13514 [Coccidioides immitis RS]|uniref:Uncharacterized protein n=1 Tax=Coccidioides immitis (strain RS) TaxID=246410 RepID=A0A0E1RUY8_COCIM|nr:uncharacterized protein CIMG_13514 [Coccidioides immitis RS]EAS27332.2 hypothetical protein CIMG_13514 [Coccidioides immitis RS]